MVLLIIIPFLNGFVIIPMALSIIENVVYPIVPNGFADHYPVFKWLAIIGKINPIIIPTIFPI